MSKELSFISDCKKTKGVQTFYFDYTPSVDDDDDDDNVVKPVSAPKLCIKCKQTPLPADQFKKVCDGCIDEME
jgi:hypothetical protein